MKKGPECLGRLVRVWAVQAGSSAKWNNWVTYTLSLNTILTMDAWIATFKYPCATTSTSHVEHVASNQIHTH